jgi:hypothetical protein
MSNKIYSRTLKKEKIFPKDDSIWKKMKKLADNYYIYQKFERNIDEKFVENIDELNIISDELFNAFNISDKKINIFLDICSAPGIYSKTLLKLLSLNNKNIKGIGITLPVDEGGIQNEIIDSRYSIIYKNILTDSCEINELIDLGIASCIGYVYDAKNSYFLNLELILKSMNIILCNLQKGGHMIINLSIINIELVFNIIYILNKYFKRFKLWKSENIWNTKKTFYYFGYEYTGDTTDYLKNKITSIIKKLKSYNDPINTEFIGSLTEYKQIYRQMHNIYKIRIKAIETNLYKK